MRGLRRQRRAAEEEESVFVTMTDLTISFLLIVMVLLALFATRISSDDSVSRLQYDALRAQHAETRTQLADVESRLVTVRAERDALTQRVQRLMQAVVELEARLALTEAERDALLQRVRELEEQLARLLGIRPLEDYAMGAQVARLSVLETLRTGLRDAFPDLEVVISPEGDALRFQGEGLFRSGSSVLDPPQQVIVRRLAGLLDDLLICYTLGERATRRGSCPDGYALIEALQIEGHTDSDGSELMNLELSTARANTTLITMLAEEPGLLDHLNLRGQPVMSVSGYGEMRPIAPNTTDAGKAANRRVDLRIIMFAPGSEAELDALQERLDSLSLR